jgi:yecA family protein
LLSAALGDGLAAGLPPAPGLIEIAELCGFDRLRPVTVTTETLINELPATERLRSLSAQARGKLINASEGWWDRHETVQSWFEESDPAHEVLEGTRSPKAVEAALWRWLETRREYWARLVARAADVLAEADDPDADSFTATALALFEGRQLKKIPIMQDVHEQTIQAWVFDDPDADQGTTLEEWGNEAEPSAPKPERKGELARLLKGAAITADWIDGFLMSVTLAPKLIAPKRWLPEILGNAVASLTPDSIQRFADLILMRANACVEQAEDPTEFVAAMSMRSAMSARDWAAGFSYARRQFRSSWPAKSTTHDDRSMIHRLSDAMATGFSAAEVKTLGQWITDRHEQNCRA